MSEERNLSEAEMACDRLAEECKRLTAALADERERVRVLREAAQIILSKFDAFKASDGNYECAYNRIAQGHHWKDWDALAAAIRATEPVQGFAPRPASGKLCFVHCGDMCDCQDETL